MIQVRPARRDEVDLIVTWQMAMAQETEGMALDRATVTRGVTALFDDPHRGAYWVAECDGRPAGCLMTMDEWSDWRNGTVIWIHSVYVPPEHRRRGVFRAIYTHLKQRVEADASLKGLRLFVDATNEKAQRTYRALGMSDEHYRMFEWLKR